MQHPDYGVGIGAYPNDIAVLQLATSANLSSEFIGKIAMADGNFDYAGERCVITGWGGTDQNKCLYSLHY